MVFRLPTQLETLVPPPSGQSSQPPPWRGSIVITGARSSDRSSSQEIFVTAVETDGEKAEQWPPTFYARVLYERSILREFQTWVNTLRPPIPICTFMPNRLRDPDHHTVNQTNFRSLSRVLFETNTVAVAPWAPNTFPGAGLVIYPAQNSSAVLIGALFFDMPFPNFLGLGGSSSPMASISPISMQQIPRHPQYAQQRISAAPPYGSSPHRHAPSLSPHLSDNNSPVEQPIAAHRQDPYRYIMPRSGQVPYNMGQPNPSSDVGWPNVKNEEGNNYSGYHPHHPPYS